MVTQNDCECDLPELAELSFGDGELVIYDPENHRAWVQSDTAVRLRARA